MLRVDELEEAFETGFEHIRIEVILALYLIQYPLFMLLKPLFFMCWTVLTCWCPPGRTFADEDTFDWSIISYDFVEHVGNYYNSSAGSNALQNLRNERIMQSNLDLVRS